MSLQATAKDMNIELTETKLPQNNRISLQNKQQPVKSTVNQNRQSIPLRNTETFESSVDMPTKSFQVINTFNSTNTS